MNEFQTIQLWKREKCYQDSKQASQGQETIQEGASITRPRNSGYSRGRIIQAADCSMDSMRVEIMRVRKGFIPARMCGLQIFANRPSFCPCGLSLSLKKRKGCCFHSPQWNPSSDKESASEASSERIESLRSKRWWDWVVFLKFPVYTVKFCSSEFLKEIEDNYMNQSVKWSEKTTLFFSASTHVRKTVCLLNLGSHLVLFWHSF